MMDNQMQLNNGKLNDNWAYTAACRDWAMELPTFIMVLECLYKYGIEVRKNAETTTCSILSPPCNSPPWT